MEFTTGFSDLSDELAVTRDHEHVTIKLGGRRALSFRCLTSDNDNYLATDTRVTLPVRTCKVIKAKPSQ